MKFPPFDVRRIVVNMAQLAKKNRIATTNNRQMRIAIHFPMKKGF
jgi:hypothetical protein